MLLAVLICAGLGLLPRLRLEEENKDIAIVVNYRDVPLLVHGMEMSPVGALVRLKEKGVGGLMVGEFTGEDILSGLGPVKMSSIGMASQFAHSDAVVQGLGTLLSIPKDFQYAVPLAELLALRTGTKPVVSDEGIDIVYPVPMESLHKSALVPDLEGLNAAKEAGLPVFYRVAPAQTWQMRQSLEVVKKILSDYPEIAVVAPSGDIALGYPDMAPLSSLLKTHSLPVAQIEFSRQLGAVQLNWQVFPNLIPLHSVTNEELLARRISRTALLDRMKRAAIERSVRLLIMRPAVSGNVDSALESFGGEVELLAENLRSTGLRMAWPKPLFAERSGWGMSWFSVFSCSLAFSISLYRCWKRMKASEDCPISVTEAFCFMIGACIVAAAAWKIAAFARLLGALTAAFVVTEASLTAMDDVQNRFGALLKGFAFATIGGLAVAALFSDPLYMLRLRTFSGVKLTLLLPPLLVLLHDMRRRIHPESLSEMLSRPPLWGELMLGVVLMALMVVVLFRSDNVQFIPGIEAQIRNALEHLLIARPRNKEIFIGYPCLLLYAFSVKAGLWAHYREVLRVGVVLGFSSVVNSFCHYHTPLLLILLREFHGLWVGTLLGLIAVAFLKYIALPFWRKIRFIVE